MDNMQSHDLAALQSRIAVDLLEMTFSGAKEPNQLISSIQFLATYGMVDQN